MASYFPTDDLSLLSSPSSSSLNPHMTTGKWLISILEGRKFRFKQCKSLTQGHPGDWYGVGLCLLQLPPWTGAEQGHDQHALRPPSDDGGTFPILKTCLGKGWLDSPTENTQVALETSQPMAPNRSAWVCGDQWEGGQSPPKSTQATLLANRLYPRHSPKASLS